MSTINRGLPSGDLESGKPVSGAVLITGLAWVGIISLFLAGDLLLGVGLTPPSDPVVTAALIVAVAIFYLAIVLLRINHGRDMKAVRNRLSHARDALSVAASKTAQESDRLQATLSNIDLSRS